MAIKFVDKESENELKARTGAAPSVDREPDAEALAKPLAPELPHPKPEPKARGRKKPLR